MISALRQLLPGLGTGLCGGVLSGLFGVGGGVVMVPLLGVLAGLDQHRAQGATLAAMLLPTGLPAVLEYRRRKFTASLRLVSILVAFFLVGIYGGAQVANSLSSMVLRWGYGALLLGMAAFTLWRQDPQPTGGAGPILEGMWTWGPLIGLAAGMVSGLTGLGGAVVVVPLLASRFRMTQHEAQLTSLMMLLPPIGLPGVYVYARAQGGLPWWLIGGVVFGFAGGAMAGARLAARLPGARLKQAYAVVVLMMALLVMWKS